MRYPGLTLRILGAGNPATGPAMGPAMGPGKAALISQIEASGSISAAARITFFPITSAPVKKRWSKGSAANCSATSTPPVVTQNSVG